MVVLVIEVGAELVTRLRGTFARRGEVQFHHVEPRSDVVISAALQFQPQVVVLGMGVIPHNTIRPLWPRLVAMYPYFVDYQARTQREIPVVVLRPIG